MRYVVAYDLESDTVRGRVADVLSGLGERVQKSVFECTLGPEELEGLVARLRTEIGETAGNVRIYRLCAPCWEAAFGIGAIRMPADAQSCVIL